MSVPGAGPAVHPVRDHCAEGSPRAGRSAEHSGPGGLAVPIWGEVAFPPSSLDMSKPPRTGPLTLICPSGGQAMPRVVMAGVPSPESLASPVSTEALALFQKALVPAIQGWVSEPSVGSK